MKGQRAEGGVGNLGEGAGGCQERSPMTAEGGRLSLARPPAKGSVKAEAMDGGGREGLKGGGIHPVSASPGHVGRWGRAPQRQI